MEDILTVLLLVLWGIFGIYKAARKNKQKNRKPAPNTAPTETPEQQTEFETILSDLLGKNKPTPAPEPVYQEEEVQLEKYQEEAVSLETPVSSDYFSFDNDIVDEEHNINAELDNYFEEHRIENKDTATASVEENKNKFEELINEPFDLKKAIIYSEILNRPYQ